VPTTSNTFTPNAVVSAPSFTPTTLSFKPSNEFVPTPAKVERPKTPPKD
jgi:hypothetical protein